MARDSLVREAVRKTAVGRFDSGPCLSVLTLWTAGDGWQPGESKPAGYPL